MRGLGRFLLNHKAHSRLSGQRSRERFEREPFEDAREPSMRIVNIELHRPVTISKDLQR
jgi:hypothetical protein